MAWIRQIRFAQIAQESTRLDYLHEVEHMVERVVRLEQAIAEAAHMASPEVQEVINGLQALRGIAHISAVTIAAELGRISRFESARQHRKDQRKIITALGRELLGFIWAIGVKAEMAARQRIAA
jgi:transposase